MALLNPSDFYALVSGRKRGPLASAARGLLRVAEVPYTAAVRWRNARYDCGRAESHAAGVPVVSVGNLTLGGTGKTPLVEWIARWYRAHQVRVTLVSRGYGAEDGAANDEALELEQKLPDVPHLQNRDRVEAALAAVEEFECQLVLLDDGFQHRRLRRDLDIVLLDASQPLGFGHVFPRGMLREPVEGLKRAHVVVLSRADMLDSEGRAAIRQQVQQLAPAAVWVEAAHRPIALLASTGQEEPLESYQNRPVAAFCGIGNPAGFRHTLQSIGYQVATFQEFPDHHHYGRDDIAALGELAQQHQAAALLCTHKDLVKIDTRAIQATPLRAVRIGLELLRGEEALVEKLKELLPGE